MSLSTYGQGAYGANLYGYGTPDFNAIAGVAPVVQGFSGPGAPSSVTVSNPLGGPVYIITPTYTGRNLFPYKVPTKRRKSQKMKPVKLYPFPSWDP